MLKRAVNAAKKLVIKQKAQEFLGDNIEIVDSGDNVLVKIKHKKFDVEIQGITVTFEYEETDE